MKGNADLAGETIVKAYKSTLGILWQKCKLGPSKILSSTKRLRPILHLIIFSLLYVAFVVVIIRYTWEWLRTDKFVSNAELIRSIAIPVGALPALFIAIWRSFTAAKQQKTDARGRLDERFQKGVEMLGSDAYIAELGGVVILERLSKEHTNEFHVQVVEVLLGFITHSTDNERLTSASSIEKALGVIGRRSRDEIDVYENDVGGRVDLTNSNLDNVKLRDLEFENIDFREASVNHAGFNGSKFINTIFIKTSLQGTVLSRVKFIDSEFSDTKFCKCKLHHAAFINSSMSTVNFNEANLYRATFVNLHAPKTSFVKTFMRRSGLQEANLESSDFSGAKMDNVNLMNAKLKQTKFVGTDLVDANFVGADLLGADLLEADLSGANLTGVENLKQEQLDNACQRKGAEPILDEGFKWDKAAALQRHRNSRRD